MERKELAKRVVDLMLENDHYSNWMDMKVVELQPGSSALEMKVKKEMLNGFSIAHGSITYALSDSALAFASNGYGYKCVSIDTQISHLKAVKEHDVLRAEAKEINRSRRLGYYEVEVKNQEGELVSHFKGTVYIKNELWFPNENE